MFDSNYKEDEIRLIGARLANLTNTKEEQISLFDEIKEDDKEDNIQKTIDDINNKFGKSIIKPASLELISKSKSKKQYFE